MIQNFEYLTVFTSAPGVLPEQNDRYQIQPWNVNEIKGYNINYIKKCFKWKLRRIKFSTKNSVTHICIPPRSRAKGLKKFAIFEIL